MVERHRRSPSLIACCTTWVSSGMTRIVADYISLMTDQYFLKQYEREFMPRQIDYD